MAQKPAGKKARKPKTSPKKTAARPRAGKKPKPAPAGGSRAGAQDRAQDKEGEWAFQLIETAPYLVSLCHRGRITYLNNTGKKWLGLRSAKKALGQLFHDFVLPEDRKNFKDAVKGLKDADLIMETRLAGVKNKTIFTEMTLQKTDAGGKGSFMVQAHDITERKEDEERILFQANYDELTGLPNRALFLDRLNQTLANAQRTRTNVGVMFIDLDGFKLVNDTLGHDVGDLLLQETSERLKKCVRNTDTVSRLGGDEFTILMPNLHDPRDAPLVATRILESIAEPFHLKGNDSFVSTSIGITVYPEDAKEAGDLLRNADSAMYQAKEKGKANYQFFTDELNREMKERLILKNGLIKAMEKKEMALFYQPKLDLGSGAITGVEALMRWNSAELGMISPARFIPVLQETGMVVEFGEWAIRAACLQHREWLDGGLPPIRVAVNLSARQLREISFVSVFENALKEIGVGAESLEIEITETLLMADVANTVTAIEELHNLGIRVAMDDFGTGYSSLSVLKRFPIDSIKIDQSFIADITTNADDAEIIRAIVTMGKTLNRTVVAEGVETREQVDMLKSYGCDQIQGYFICPPQPAAELTKFLQEKLNPGQSAPKK